MESERQQLDPMGTYDTLLSPLTNSSGPLKGLSLMECLLQPSLSLLTGSTRLANIVVTANISPSEASRIFAAKHAATRLETPDRLRAKACVPEWVTRALSGTFEKFGRRRHATDFDQARIWLIQLVLKEKLLGMRGTVLSDPETTVLMIKTTITSAIRQTSDPTVNNLSAEKIHTTQRYPLASHPSASLTDTPSNGLPPRFVSKYHLCDDYAIPTDSLALFL